MIPYQRRGHGINNPPYACYTDHKELDVANKYATSTQAYLNFIMTVTELFCVPLFNML